MYKATRDIWYFLPHIFSVAHHYFLKMRVLWQTIYSLNKSYASFTFIINKFFNTPTVSKTKWKSSFFYQIIFKSSKCSCRNCMICAETLLLKKVRIVCFCSNVSVWHIMKLFIWLKLSCRLAFFWNWSE